MKTIGELRVRVEFNPSESSDVHTVKSTAAESINLMDTLGRTSVEPHKSGERQRLISLAQIAYEEAAMWAVKALTI
jgi:hypothetical protein